VVADMFSDVGSQPSCLLGKGCVNGRQGRFLIIQSC